MKRRTDLLVLVLLALLVFGAASVRIDSPGYLDADYYRSVALRVATGHGLTVPFLWNFLSGSTRLPAPAHTYWMPLASLVGSLTTLFAPESFRSTQVAFLLMASVLPALTYLVSLRMGLDRRSSLIAGLLACFPGYYLPFWLTSDTFALFAILGTAVLLLGSSAGEANHGGKAFLAGAAVGLGHLTRADGLLLWIPLLVVMTANRDRRWRRLVLAAGGYLAAMLPWAARNAIVIGSPLPLGTSQVLWLTSYDQLFAYPADTLSPQAFLASGLGRIVAARADAVLANLTSLTLVNGLAYLVPPLVVGAWQMRKHRILRGAAAYLLVLFLAMSILFPYAGRRGGFFHSSTVLMPFIYPVSVVGVERIAAWYARVRELDPLQAVRVLRVGMVVIAFLATGFLYEVRVIQGGWDIQREGYERLVQDWSFLARDDIVAVNNPAAFWLASAAQAVVIPDGSPETLLTMMTDLDVKWAVLESNHPAGLEPMYRQPSDRAGLHFRTSYEVGSGEVLRIYSPDPGEDGE